MRRCGRWEGGGAAGPRLGGDEGRAERPRELVVLEGGRHGERVGDAGGEVRRLGEHARAPGVELGAIRGRGAGPGGLHAAGDEAVVLHALADALLRHVDALGLLERRPDALDAVVGVVVLEVPARRRSELRKPRGRGRLNTHFMAARRSSAET